MSTWLKKNV